MAAYIPDRTFSAASAISTAVALMKLAMSNSGAVNMIVFTLGGRATHCHLSSTKDFEMPHSDKSQPQPQNTRDAQIGRLADYIEETGLTPLPLPQEFYYSSLPGAVRPIRTGLHKASMAVLYAAPRPRTRREQRCG